MATLTLAQASTIVDVALKTAREKNFQPLTVAVLDPGGHLVAFKREDKSGILRYDIAYGKAWGALGMGFGSRTLAERAAQTPQFFTMLAAASGGRMIANPGGILIRDAAGEGVRFVDASGIATALLGNSIAANMFMLGHAYQQGLVPLTQESIFRALDADESLRCVVLSGEGRAFCAGLDMQSFAAMGDAGVPGARDLAKRTHGIANVPQQCAWQWRTLPVPVIAAVHGVAFGGGFQIMLGADMRYATADTRFSVMEIKWGLVPDLAGTQLMRHLVREDVARELTYTGRIFNGTEAQQLGIVTKIVEDPRAAAMETAKEIANKSPDAIRAAKRILNDAVAVDAAAGLMAESVEQQKLIGSPNQIEAVMSNLQKRAANYKD